MMVREKFKEQGEKILSDFKSILNASVLYTQRYYESDGSYGYVPFMKELYGFMKYDVIERESQGTREKEIQYIVPPKMAIHLMGWKVTQSWHDVHVLVKINDILLASINTPAIFQQPHHIWYARSRTREKGALKCHENDSMSLITIVPNDLNRVHVDATVYPILFLIAPQEFIKLVEELRKERERKESRKPTRIDMIEL